MARAKQLISTLIRPLDGFEKQMYRRELCTTLGKVERVTRHDVSLPSFISCRNLLRQNDLLYHLIPYGKKIMSLCMYSYCTVLVPTYAVLCPAGVTGIMTV